MWVYIVTKTDEYQDTEIDMVFDTEEKANDYVYKEQDNKSYDIDASYSYNIYSHKVK